MYPLRGAVTWKSTAGTNVASDALSNLASGGVTGGAMIIIGEDYGEGSSIMQERTHAYAMKSQIWLLDPRPESADHRAHGREGLRAVGGVQHAGHARSAHPRLPRARQLRLQGQTQAGASRCARRWRTRRATSVASCCRPPRSCTRRRRSSALAGGDRIHQVAQAQRDDRAHGGRRRHHHARAACTTASSARSAISRPRRRLRPAAVPLYVLNVAYPLIEDESSTFCRDKRRC